MRSIISSTDALALAVRILALAAWATFSAAEDRAAMCAGSWNMAPLNTRGPVSFCGTLPEGSRFYPDTAFLLWNPDTDSIGVHTLRYTVSAQDRSVTNTLSITVKKLEKALFLFAHSDDEFGIIAKIKRMKDAGCGVILVWTSSSSKRRMDESKTAMHQLGVKDEETFFFRGKSISSSDGFGKTVDCLKELLLRQQIDQIYIPAYEGGHVQHDLTHAAAVAACRASGFNGQIYEFGLYHLEGVFPMPFSLLLAPSPTIQMSLDKNDMAFLESLSKNYRSQTFITAGFRMGMSERKKAHPAYRPLPAWDYSRPPRNGILWYTANLKHPASFTADFIPAVRDSRLLLMGSAQPACCAQDKRRSEIGTMLLPDRKSDKPVRVHSPFSLYAYAAICLVLAFASGTVWKTARFFRAKRPLVRSHRSPPA